MAANPEVADYIRRAALARKIDPNIALKVAGSEALNVFDPNQPDRGGDLGSSFGPFQLHYGGMTPSMNRPGMGDDFTKATGLHASDPSTWRQQVDFALDQAKRGGWAPWMGAKRVGIVGRAGIDGAPSIISPQPVSSWGGAPAPAGQVTAGVPTQQVQSIPVPDLYSLAMTYMQNRKADEVAQAAEQEAEQTRKAALFGGLGDLFG
jgi:hypothetical protein